MLPERINVMKAITYDVNWIANDIRGVKEDASYAPTIGEVLDWMTEWVLEDFDVVDCNGLIFQDENGEEL